MGELKTMNTNSIEESFLVKYNPSKTLSKSIETVDQARSANMPTLNSLKRLNEEDAVSLVALYINELNIELNIGDKMSMNNINITAIRVIQKYGFMKLSDIIFILNKFLDGEIKLYGSISRKDIMGALHDHSERRSMR